MSETIVRLIHLPALHRRVTIGQYVQAIRLAKANPDEEFTTGLTTWWPTTGAEIMQQFRTGLHDRINQTVPYIERGIPCPPPNRK